MSIEISNQKVTDNDCYTLLPAVFTVNTLSGKTTHLGNTEKTPLCGTRLYSPTLTETQLIYDKNDKEYKEHWVSELRANKWVVVCKYDYCQRCLSALNGR